MLQWFHLASSLFSTFVGLRQVKKSQLNYSCSIYILPFATQNKAEIFPRFQSFLLPLWTKGVEWVKVLNALGALCLLKALKIYRIYGGPDIWLEVGGARCDAKTFESNCGSAPISFSAILLRFFHPFLSLSWRRHHKPKVKSYNFFGHEKALKGFLPGNKLKFTLVEPAWLRYSHS